MPKQHHAAIPRTDKTPPIRVQRGIGTSEVDTPQPVQIQHGGNRHAIAMRSGIGIQRMPTRGTVIGTLGKPIADVKLFGIGKSNSTRYKAILAKLDAFHRYTTTTNAGANRAEVMSRLQSVLTHIDEIITACDAYQGETDDKAKYFLRLKIQAQNEKTSAISALASHADRVHTLSSFVRASAKISGVLLQSAPGNLDMDESKLAGTVGGGINQLGMFNEAGGGKSFFKENTQTIEKGDMNDLSSPLTTANYTAMDAGIDRRNVRSANRDVATYRLDQLLNANITARTQFAIRTIAGEEKLGSLMAGAQGQRAGDIANKGNLVNTPNAGPGQITTQDPNLMRQLSKLQLMDALAGQIDRNYGNFFIQFDGSGKVTGISAIDNDASFGKRADINPFREFPGVSQYLDKKMADAILAIPDALYQTIVSDLLTPEETDAFMKRLNKLKQHLNNNATKLLTPDQWDQAVHLGLLKENKSFTAGLGK